MAGRPRKEVATEGEAKENNIANLAELKKELLQGLNQGGKIVPMPERKRVAFRVKLISLHKEGIASPDEEELMEIILGTERKKGTILSSDEYMLNALEEARISDTCVVKTQNPPATHHLFPGLVCKYLYDIQAERFIIYVPRIVPTEHQLSVATVRKENMGHPTDPKDYPAPRTLIHRIAIKDTEFRAWFDVADADPLATIKEQNETAYTF